MSSLFVKREFFTSRAFAHGNSEPPKLLKDWRDIAAVGHRIGPDHTRLTMVVFTDFECPACGYFATKVLPELQKQYPNDFAVVFRHWPLDIHRFAYPAARAAECAGAQGRYPEFHRAIYAQQKALGLKTFDEFAVESGVSDIHAFSACVRDTNPVPAIEADVRAVQAIGGTGTPTIIFNGWLFRGGASLQAMDSTAKALLQQQPGS
jgi:protein-disulfide isomerase